VFIYGFDILLYILDSPVTFTNEIQPACLPFDKSPYNYPYIGSTVLIAGWGLTDGSDPNSIADVLQNALVQISSCTAGISESFFCSSN
jgi:hypothetical protein